MQNAVGPTKRTSNNTREKKKKKSRSINATKPMAPGALQHCGASCQKKSTVLWCSEASVLLIYSFTSGSYYWRRQIKGLEGFWQVDKCCLTRQSTGQTVRCSLTTLTLHPPATKGFELISHAHSHTHREPWIYPLVQGHRVSELLCLGGSIKDCVFFFLNHERELCWGRHKWNFYDLCVLARYFLIRYLLSTEESAQGQREKLTMTSKKTDTVWEKHIFICLCCWRGCQDKGMWVWLKHDRIIPQKMNEE